MMRGNRLSGLGYSNFRECTSVIQENRLKGLPQSLADIDIDNGSTSPRPENNIKRQASTPFDDEVQSELESNDSIILPHSNEEALARSRDNLWRENMISDIEAIKERFSNLLLGEDMSGGGKGIPSTLALSNAITNPAASVFREHRKLEPMPPEMKARWQKEIDWLLAVTDQIVEFAPSKQSNNITFEDSLIEQTPVHDSMTVPVCTIVPARNQIA